MKSLSVVLFVCLTPLAAVAQIAVQTPLSLDREASPGESYVESILVANETDEPQQFKVYQTDYRFAADGSNAFDEPGSHARSNAGWVDVGASVVTLGPRETSAFDVRLNVPEHLPEGGTYWSMLMVEGIPAGSAESTLGAPDAAPTLGMMQVTRYGIQLATHLSGGTPEVRFARVEIAERDGGGAQLLVDLENIGARLAHVDVTVELFTESGDAVGRRGGNRYRVYPDTSVRQQIDLSDLAGSTYEALILVDDGSGDVLGAQYTLAL
jgi:hypothetical protein